MFDSAILDVAIGLAFTFLLFSLLITALSEMLSSFLRWRARFLWEGLANLLRSNDARDALYAHPLIRGLTRTIDSRKAIGKRTGPSYIPSKTFAIVLLDILREPHRAADAVAARLRGELDALHADPAAAVRRIVATLDECAGATPAPPRELLERIKDLKARILTPADPAVIAGFQSRVREVLQRIPAGQQQAVAAPVLTWLDKPVPPATTYADFRAEFARAIDNVPFAGQAADDTRAALRSLLRGFEQGDPDRAVAAVRAFAAARAADWIKSASATLKSDTLERVLVPLLDDAANDVERFRENIEVWFNTGMDRVSGWYKRYTARVHFFMALLLAAIMNIDVLAITRTLWREPSLREAIVNQAGAAVQVPPLSLAPPAVEQSGNGPDPIVARMTSPFVEAGAVASIDIVLPASTAAGDRVLITEDSSYVVLLDAEREETASLPLTAKGGGETLRVFIKALDPPGDSLEAVKIAIVKAPSGAAAKSAQVTFVTRPSADKRFQLVRGQIAGLGLPIGWRLCALGQDATTLKRPFWCEYDWSTSGKFGWVGSRVGFVLFPLTRLDGWAMMLGWLIAAVAGALGAPFWFDTLKRFMSIRSTGKAPEERPHAPKEVSQPPEPGQRPKEADMLAALRAR